MHYETQKERESEREENSHVYNESTSILRLAVHFIIINSFSLKKRTTYIYIFGIKKKNVQIIPQKYDFKNAIFKKAI